jgi:hypothetical protein
MHGVSGCEICGSILATRYIRASLTDGGQPAEVRGGWEIDSA